MAYLVSFLAGGCIVLSRTVNALLSEHTGPIKATLINNAVGAIAALVFFAISSEWLSLSLESALKAPWYVYLGGVFGIGVVYLSNVTTLKIPAFLLTLIIFLAQMATGFMLDLLMGISIDWLSFLGVCFILIGLIVQMTIETQRKKASE